ncbi:MAG: DUF2782 domain-containing protein [Thioalkalivibrionaceae bacterium]
MTSGSEASRTLLKSDNAKALAPTPRTTGGAITAAIVLFASVVTLSTAQAQSFVPDASPAAGGSATATNVPPPPAIDADGDSGERIPPTLDERARALEELENAEVTIIDGVGERRLEYRVEGQLIFVEVIPEVGPSYYLIDTNGDGTMDSRRDDLAPGFISPRWRIFQW